MNGIANVVGCGDGIATFSMPGLSMGINLASAAEAAEWLRMLPDSFNRLMDEGRFDRYKKEKSCEGNEITFCFNSADFFSLR